MMKYELKYVFKQKIKLTCVIVVYLLANWYFFHKEIEGLHTMGLIHGETYMDLLYYFFRGNKDFLYSDSGSLFNIPGYFLVFHGFIAFIIGNSFGKKELGLEDNFLLRCGQRKKWLFIKWVSIAIRILWVYLLVYVVFFILSMLGGYEVSGITTDTLEILTNQRIQGKLDLGSLVLMLFVLPPLVSLALSELQFVISIIFGNIIGYIFVLSQLVIGVYYTRNLNLVTYWMALRNENVVTYGVNDKLGIIECIVFLLVSLAVGLFYIKRKDFYGGKSD